MDAAVSLARNGAGSRSGGIVRLSELVIDQIAAGEVIERPAAVVKELVENAIDAGAARIAVALDAGGIGRIEVADDGCGMDAASLALAIGRHCTSKLGPLGTLDVIRTLGFRGEALPSIGAAARLAIVSRPADGDAARISVEGGKVSGPVPCAGVRGTVALVEDLFYATPARRKFLKSARIEAEHAEAAVARLAAAHPEVAMSVAIDGRTVLDRPAEGRAARIAALLGPAAQGGLIEVAHVRDGLVLEGLALGPGSSRATTAAQYLTVNGRPVADPVLRTAIRVAYRDVIERGRHAALALALAIPHDAVDVNVHPGKTELRFADPDGVRALVIGGLRRALAGAIGTGAVPARPVGFKPRADAVRAPAPAGFAEARLGFDAGSVRRMEPATGVPAEPATGVPAAPSRPLGEPVAQVLDTYVISLADDGSLILTDQHAAHERLTQERLAASLDADGVRAQALLLPEVVELPARSVARLVEAAATLARLGVELEGFGPGAVLVRALPALLGNPEPARLLADIADELAATGETVALTDALDRVIARMACHGSIRAGRRLGADEMSSLLRAMEATPRAATCSHGRPTYLRLSRSELERMFGRSG